MLVNSIVLVTVIPIFKLYWSNGVQKPKQLTIISFKDNILDFLLFFLKVNIPHFLSFQFLKSKKCIKIWDWFFFKFQTIIACLRVTIITSCNTKWKYFNWSTISWWESVPFWWHNHDCFVLNIEYEFYF